MSQAPKQKTLALTRSEQQRAYLNARAAVIRDKGPDVTEGEIVEELACAYTGYDGGSGPGPSICGLVTETAAENGDPVFTVDELKDMTITEIRRLAADADTEAVSGRSTKMEIIAYFSCPYSVEVDNGFPEPR